MATYQRTLDAPSTEDSPIKLFLFTMNGADILELNAGHTLAIPNLWRPIEIKFYIGCSADVANRNCTVRLRSRQTGTYSFNTISMTNNVTANNTGWLEITGNIYFDDATMGGVTALLGMTEDAWTIGGQDYLYFAVTNGHANDSVVIQGRFRYMNNAWNMSQPYPIYKPTNIIRNS